MTTTTKFSSISLGFFKTAISILAVLVVWGCQPPTPTGPAELTPIILVIGHDISKTFKGFDKLDTANVRQLLYSVATHGTGAVLAFQTIGNPTDRSLLRIELQAVPQIDPSLTLSEKAALNEQILAIQKLNAQAIDHFVLDCAKQIYQPHQQDTDLNRFISKAVTMLSEPQFDGYEKLLFLHTDGIHDVRGDKKLECSIPAGCSLYTCGWENEAACGASAAFDSPVGFVQFLQKKFKI